MPRPCLSARPATVAPALALLLAAAARTADAQRADAPVVLRTAPSARALAMGGGLPVASDAESQLANPALLAWGRGLSVQGARWSDAATLGTATSATPALAGTVGLGVQYLDWGARAARLPDAARDATGALGTRGPVPAASLAASVAYARPLLGLRAGVAVKALEERLGATRDHALAVDVGVAKGFLFDNVVLALAAQNLGRGLDLAGGRAALPSRVTVGIAGAGYPLRSWLDVGVSYALSVLRGGGVVTGGGVEAALVPLDGYAIALRTGVRRTPDPRERPVTAGLGLTRDRLSLDYAYEPLAGQDAHRVGVRLR